MPLISLADFERDALPTLMEFGAIPSLSPMFDEEWAEHGYLDAAAELLADWARSRQIQNADVQIHHLEGRTPMLVVTIDSTAGDEGTVVLYGHLDKQPPLGDWSNGLDPFTPTRRGDRLYARGVADDGYAAFSALSAIEAMERNGIPHARCVVLIEASEESGSMDLEAYLDDLADHLGDVQLLICLDSGALTYDRLWVTTSLRGVLNLEVTVRVLEQGQHSGSASGVVPSSFRVLRQLIDRLEDARTGEVLVAEMQPDIPLAHRQAAHDIAEEFGEVIARELPMTDGVEIMGTSAEERILRRNWFPTLSIIGMGGIPHAGHRGQRIAPLHHGGAVLSASAERRLAPSRRGRARLAHHRRPLERPGHDRAREPGRRLGLTRAGAVARPGARAGFDRRFRSLGGLHGRRWVDSLSRIARQALSRRAVRRDWRRRTAVKRSRHRRNARAPHGGRSHERGGYCVRGTRRQIFQVRIAS